MVVIIKQKKKTKDFLKDGTEKKIKNEGIDVNKITDYFIRTEIYLIDDCNTVQMQFSILICMIIISIKSTRTNSHLFTFLSSTFSSVILIYNNTMFSLLIYTSILLTSSSSTQTLSSFLPSALHPVLSPSLFI